MKETCNHLLCVYCLAQTSLSFCLFMSYLRYEISSKQRSVISMSFSFKQVIVSTNSCCRSEEAWFICEKISRFVDISTVTVCNIYRFLRRKIQTKHRKAPFYLITLGFSFSWRKTKLKRVLKKFAQNEFFTPCTLYAPVTNYHLWKPLASNKSQHFNYVSTSYRELTN